MGPASPESSPAAPLPRAIDGVRMSVTGWGRALPTCCQDQGGFVRTHGDGRRHVSTSNMMTDSDLLPEVLRHHHLEV